MSVTESPLSKWGPLAGDCDNEKAILRGCGSDSVVELFSCCRDGVSFGVVVCMDDVAGVWCPLLSLRMTGRPGGMVAE